MTDKRKGICTDDDAIEGLRSIEIHFAMPVTMSQEQQARIAQVFTELVQADYNQPEVGAHWISFVGGRMNYSAVDRAFLAGSSLGLGSSSNAAPPPDGAEPECDDSAFVMETAVHDRPPREKKR